MHVVTSPLSQFQPDAMHGASMSVEDAETLGNLFSRIHHKDEIPRLLATYEELRIQRTSEVQDYEPRKVDMLTLPKGSESFPLVSLLRLA